MSKVKCNICPKECILEEGQKGFCKARICKNNKVISDNYGMITSIALDAIEKKPLKRFYPRSKILSVGSYGCNLNCPFCQNYQISMSDNVDKIYISPKELIQQAIALKPKGNIGIAFTYNEPFISYEYMYDVFKLAHSESLKTVIVTNGYVCKNQLLKLLPYVSAMNIDLKAFNDEFYNKIGGNLNTVKETIELSSKQCHVEVTTLIIPDKNDSKKEMNQLSEWLSSIDKDIPLHISRFFPRYKMLDINATPIETIYNLADIARKNLSYVYQGNI